MGELCSKHTIPIPFNFDTSSHMHHHSRKQYIKIVSLAQTMDEFASTSEVFSVIQRMQITERPDEFGPINNSE